VTARGAEAGSTAANSMIRKCHKYQDILCGVDFVPVAIETSGAWGKQAIGLIKEIGRRQSGDVIPSAAPINRRSARKRDLRSWTQSARCRRVGL